jgi:hypothetical protein
VAGENMAMVPDLGLDLAPGGSVSPPSVPGPLFSAELDGRTPREESLMNNRSNKPGAHSDNEG